MNSEVINPSLPPLKKITTPTNPTNTPPTPTRNLGGFPTNKTHSFTPLSSWSWSILNPSYWTQSRQFNKLKKKLENSTLSIEDSTKILTIILNFKQSDSSTFAEKQFITYLINKQFVKDINSIEEILPDLSGRISALTCIREPYYMYNLTPNGETLLKHFSSTLLFPVNINASLTVLEHENLKIFLSNPKTTPIPFSLLNKLRQCTGTSIIFVEPDQTDTIENLCSDSEFKNDFLSFLGNLNSLKLENPDLSEEKQNAPLDLLSVVNFKQTYDFLSQISIKDDNSNFKNFHLRYSNKFNIIDKLTQDSSKPGSSIELISPLLHQEVLKLDFSSKELILLREKLEKSEPTPLNQFSKEEITLYFHMVRYFQCINKIIKETKTTPPLEVTDLSSLHLKDDSQLPEIQKWKQLLDSTTEPSFHPDDWNKKYTNFLENISEFDQWKKIINKIQEMNQASKLGILSNLDPMHKLSLKEYYTHKYFIELTKPINSKLLGIQDSEKQLNELKTQMPTNLQNSPYVRVSFIRNKFLTSTSLIGRINAYIMENWHPYKHVNFLLYDHDPKEIKKHGLWDDGIYHDSLKGGSYAPHIETFDIDLDRLISNEVNLTEEQKFKFKENFHSELKKIIEKDRPTIYPTNSGIFGIDLPINALKKALAFCSFKFRKVSPIEVTDPVLSEKIELENEKLDQEILEINNKKTSLINELNTIKIKSDTNEITQKILELNEVIKTLDEVIKTLRNRKEKVNQDKTQAFCSEFVCSCIIKAHQSLIQKVKIETKIDELTHLNDSTNEITLLKQIKSEGIYTSLKARDFIDKQKEKIPENILSLLKQIEQREFAPDIGLSFYGLSNFRDLTSVIPIRLHQAFVNQTGILKPIFNPVRRD